MIISKVDQRVIVKAYYTLLLMNKKYRKPHGDNPVGIVIEVCKAEIKRYMKDGHKERK
jgi:hypothetical protein